VPPTSGSELPKHRPLKNAEDTLILQSRSRSMRAHRVVGPCMSTVETEDSLSQKFRNVKSKSPDNATEKPYYEKGKSFYDSETAVIKNVNCVGLKHMRRSTNTASPLKDVHAGEAQMFKSLKARLRGQ
jgi:hypothetical protein